jgi:hypothetical protein
VSERGPDSYLYAPQMHREPKRLLGDWQRAYQQLEAQVAFAEATNQELSQQNRALRHERDALRARMYEAEARVLQAERKKLSAEKGSRA